MEQNEECSPNRNKKNTKERYLDEKSAFKELEVLQETDTFKKLKSSHRLNFFPRNRSGDWFK